MRAGSFADGWTNMARFWKAIFSADKSFDLNGSSLTPLINLIAGGAAGGGQNFTTAQLQTELDKIPLDKAKKYKDALKILVDDYVDVCYTAIDTINQKEVSRGMNVQVAHQALGANDWGNWSGTKSGYVEWNSAKYDIEVKVFQIVPTGNRFDIGFVQHCTRKENNGKYSSGETICDHPTQPAPWCDSNPATSFPWYTKGIHNGKTAWATLAAGINTPTYGMDDSFDNRRHPYMAVKSGTGAVANTKINELKCEQDFSAWICRHDNTANTMLLLKKFSYTIKGEFKVTAANQATGTSTSVKINAAETPALTATLPATNAQSMNTNERWFRNGAQI